MSDEYGDYEEYDEYDPESNYNNQAPESRVPEPCPQCLGGGYISAHHVCPACGGLGSLG